MKGKIFILSPFVALSFMILTPAESLSGDRSPAGFYQGTVNNLEEANKSFQNNNVVEATVRLVIARENLNKLQKQLQDAEGKLNEAVRFLNQSKIDQAKASVTLALDALNPAKQIMEAKPAPAAQRTKRENLKAVKEDLVQAREHFKSGDVAGAIQSIRSSQDTLNTLQQQYPEYQKQIQDAQSRLTEAIYFLNQNKPKEAATSVKSVADILEPLREGQ
jgi:flagellin-specific chaperone FliS